jgi:hypothetical protein
LLCARSMHTPPRPLRRVRSAVLLTASMLAGCLGAPPPQPGPASTRQASSASNLVADPGFELQGSTSGPLSAPWVAQGPATIGFDVWPTGGGTATNGPHSGTHDGYIYSPGAAAWSAITQTVAVAANTRYTLSGWLQTSANSAFSGGELGVETPGGTVIQQTAIPASGTYVQLSLTFNSGANTSVVIFGGFTPAGTSWMHLDDVALVPVPVTNLVQDPGFELQGTSGTLSAPWVATGPAAIGVDVWPAGGGTTTNGPHSGTHDGYIYSPGAAAWSAITQTVAVSANTSYTLTGWLQTSGSSFSNGEFGVTTASGGAIQQTAIPASSTYVQLTVNFNSGANTSVLIYGGFTPSGVSWMHLDDVSLLPGSGTCTPTTCAAHGANCGSIPDGCGGTLTCGTCTAPQTCGGGGTSNVCGTSGGGGGCPAGSVSVTSSGATGNGSTDDTAALQRAVNSAPGGSTLCFPAGTYRTSGSVNLKGNVTYFGANASAEVGPGGGGVVFTTDTGASGLTLEGLVLNGGGLQLGDNTQGTLIDHCTFENMTGGPNAIHCNSSSHLQITNNLFQNLQAPASSSNPDDYAGYEAIFPYNSDALVITGNTFSHFGEGAHIIWQEPGSAGITNWTGPYIANNVATGQERMWMEIQTFCDWQDNIPCIVHNTLIENNSVSHPDVAYWGTFAISAAIGNSVGTVVRNNFLAADNPTVIGWYGYGIEMIGTDMSVLNNTLEGPWGGGNTGVVVCYNTGTVATVGGNSFCGNGPTPIGNECSGGPWPSPGETDPGTNKVATTCPSGF